MKRYVSLALAVAAVLSVAGAAQADWRSWTYGGFQPWWNPFGLGKRHCQSPEERRLQRFWHDYYDAQRRYYKSLEHLDWVSYYKNHGQPTGGCGPGGCGGPPQFAPVTVSPTMAWAVPPGAGCGPGGCPHGQGGPVPAAYGPQQAPPMMGMYPGYGAPNYGYPGMPTAPTSPVGYYHGQ